MKSKTIIPVYKGIWRDTYEFDDGREGFTTEWNHNQAQNTAAILSAILFGKTLKNEASSWGGIQFLALGQGYTDWDLSEPTLEDMPYSDTILIDEIDRIQVSNGTNVFFLDPDTELPSIIPTRMLQINVLIPFDRGNGDLREFALFGGDATSVQDSGYMINWVAHTKIEKDARTQILREMRLKWLTLDEITIE